MSVQRIERALLSVLQPLVGGRATGNATVRATGPDIELPKNSYATPVIVSGAGSAQAASHRMVKTTEATVVTAAGVPVPITSVMGGPDAGLPAGAVLVWDPPIAGVELRSVVAGGGVTGQTTASGLGTAKKIVVFEGLGQSTVAEAFWRADGVGDFPACALSWEGASEAAPVGRGRQQRVHRFRLYVVTSRFDSALGRQDEGKAILDAACELLCDRAAVDGEVFSAVPTVLGSAGRLGIAPTSHVYFQEFLVTYTTTRREARTFTDWLTTDLSVETPE